jgi:hypothetical protein
MAGSRRVRPALPMGMKKDPGSRRGLFCCAMWGNA